MGENIRKVGIQVRNAIESVSNENPDSTVLMVSHGAAMWGLCLDLGISFPPGVHFQTAPFASLTCSTQNGN